MAGSKRSKRVMASRMISLASRHISLDTLKDSLTATEGERSRRSSSMGTLACCWASPLSFTSHSTSLTSSLVAGSRVTVATMLKQVCSRAMSQGCTALSRMAGANRASAAIRTMRQMILHRVLMTTCRQATRRALALVPMEEISAVTQVPMF